MTSIVNERKREKEKERERERERETERERERERDRVHAALFTFVSFFVLSSLLVFSLPSPAGFISNSASVAG